MKDGGCVVFLLGVFDLMVALKMHQPNTIQIMETKFLSCFVINKMNCKLKLRGFVEKNMFVCFLKTPLSYFFLSFSNCNFQHQLIREG